MMPWSVYAAPPHINWKQYYGPQMYWAGRLHWLTWWERFMLAYGLTSAEAIASRRFARPLSESPVFEEVRP